MIHKWILFFAAVHLSCLAAPPAVEQQARAAFVVERQFGQAQRAGDVVEQLFGFHASTSVGWINFITLCRPSATLTSGRQNL